jgi:anti-sigma28 factor (negative regulator of flagellin synthesis)
MRLLPLGEQITTEMRKVENARKVEKDPKVKAFRSEKPEFSSSGQRLSETKDNVDVVTSVVTGAPEIREDKIIEVKEKIRNGFYNSPEFVDKLANKLMTEFGYNGKSA